MDSRKRVAAHIIAALALLALLALPALAQAQSCRTYEYAELKDMPKDVLVKLHCEYFSNMSVLTKISIANDLRGPAHGQARRCLEEVDRIERILLSMHKMPQPPCSPVGK